MKKIVESIVLVNVWHDDNKGDGGIAEGVLRLLYKRYPAAQFSVVSMFPESTQAYQTAHRHLKETFPEVTVVASPFLAHDPSRSGGIFRLLSKLWQVPRSLTQVLLPSLFNQPALQLIAKADLVVANGGQYLFTHKNYLNSLFTVYRLLYPLLIARSCKVPYLLFSQSFGFHNANRLDNALVRSTLAGAIATWTREEISYKQLLKLGISESKLALVPDAAFWLEPMKTQRVVDVLTTHGLKPKAFWAITVRQWSTYTTEFLDEMEILIRTVLQAGFIEAIALVAHTHGPSEGGDDRTPTKALFNRLQDCTVTLIEDDLAPSELVALYREAQLMIGTRFHSVIFALVGGTPAYAISYAGPKTWGIMKLLGLEHLCSDMKRFSAQEVLDRFKETDFEKIAAHLPDQVNGLRKQLEDHLDRLNVEIDTP